MTVFVLGTYEMSRTDFVIITGIAVMVWREWRAMVVYVTKEGISVKLEIEVEVEVAVGKPHVGMGHCRVRLGCALTLGQ